MKQRPSFPARLDSTVATARPNAHGLVSGRATSAKPLSLGIFSAASATPMAAPSERFEGKAPLHAVQQMPTGLGMDSHAVRLRMVQKLAGQGVSDPMVLGAMGAIERHRFVDSALVNQAYEDTSLPIGLGQTISKPGVVSRMIELLRNGNTGRLGRVLEIGTGCGYQAAVLSLVADEVYSMERLRGLHEKARQNLRDFRLSNLHLLFGDGTGGYPSGAPYAGIIAAAGGQVVPQAWVEQLALGGRLVAPVVISGGTQALLVLDKTPRGVHQTLLEAVHFVPLKSGIG